jgi:hypothetical protein
MQFRMECDRKDCKQKSCRNGIAATTGERQGIRLGLLREILARDVKREAQGVARRLVYLMVADAIRPQLPVPAFLHALGVG